MEYFVFFAEGLYDSIVVLGTRMGGILLCTAYIPIPILLATPHRSDQVLRGLSYGAVFGWRVAGARFFATLYQTSVSFSENSVLV